MKNLILFFPSKNKAAWAFEWLWEEMTLREQQMLTRVPQDHVNIYMIRTIDNFFGKNEFLPQFQLHNQTWKKHSWTEKIFWDLVYGFRMPQWVTHTHPSKISEITKDKRIIEVLFPEYSMKSIVCNNYSEILQNFENILSDLKVLKPHWGFLWKWISIGQDIPQESELWKDDYPYLLQDFHDTSWGFYDLSSGLHDFRVVILDGKIIAKLLREPWDWKYISNTFQWGKIQDIFDFPIPRKIQEIINTIDNYCKKYEHRYYAIDMGLWVNGDIKVFEINWAPGYASEYMAHEFWDYIVKNILKIS